MVEYKINLSMKTENNTFNNLILIFIQEENDQKNYDRDDKTKSKKHSHVNGNLNNICCHKKPSELSSTESELLLNICLPHENEDISHSRRDSLTILFFLLSTLVSLVHDSLFVYIHNDCFAFHES